MNVFDIQCLNLWYGHFHALKDISLVIPGQSVTALIGPSGCGKSSFLRCLNRMNEMIEGCAIYGLILCAPDMVRKMERGGRKKTPSPDTRWQDMRELDINELRRRVGMVFQKPNPFPMSIFENVAYGPKTHERLDKGQLEERVEEALRGAALWDEVKDRLKKSALGLSGGQQQRLCLARALAARPDVLLMDEPTSALDPLATMSIEDLLGELKKTYAIVIVTHNMQQALRVSDRTAFFLLGEIIEENSTETIFMHPRDERTERYISGRFG